MSGAQEKPLNEYVMIPQFAAHYRVRVRDGMDWMMSRIALSRW
jgi:hypothetical protein